MGARPLKPLSLHGGEETVLARHRIALFPNTWPVFKSGGAAVFRKRPVFTPFSSEGEGNTFSQLNSDCP